MYVPACACAKIKTERKRTPKSVDSLNFIQGLQSCTDERGSEELGAALEAFFHSVGPGLAGSEHLDAVFVLVGKESVRTFEGVWKM